MRTNVKNAAVSTATGVDTTGDVKVSDVHMGTDGGMTVDGQQSNATLEKEVQDVRASGQYIVEIRAGADLGKCLSQIASAVIALEQVNVEGLGSVGLGSIGLSSTGTGSLGTGIGTGGTGGTGTGTTGGTGTGSTGIETTLAKRQQGAVQLLDGFNSLLSMSIVVLGGTRVEPVGTGGFPGFKDLRQGADSAAQATQRFPIETNNAHADPQVLRWDGGTVDYLLQLADALTRACQRIGRTTLPLGQELSSTIADVCAAALPELPRNLDLQKALGPALAYNTANAAKTQQTKAKNKAAQKKGAKQPQTGPAAQGGATGTPAAGGAPGTPPRLG